MFIVHCYRLCLCLDMCARICLCLILLVFLLVMEGLLILVINCQKGHTRPRQHCSAMKTLKSNIARIAKAVSHKLPGKSSLNVILSCPVLSWVHRAFGTLAYPPTPKLHFLLVFARKSNYGEGYTEMAVIQRCQWTTHSGYIFGTFRLHIRCNMATFCRHVSYIL